MPLLTLLAAHWRTLAVLVLVGILAGYGAAMRLQRDAVRADYAEFKTKVAQAAEAAAAEALKHTIADEKRRETADAEHAQAVAALTDRIKRLRDARAGRSAVPPAPSGSSRPELACFDRSAFERAYGELVAEVRGLADEGAAATVDLDSAKRWTQGK